jgi:hypothetical protein
VDRARDQALATVARLPTEIATRMSDIGHD